MREQMGKDVALIEEFEADPPTPTWPANLRLWEVWSKPGSLEVGSVRHPGGWNSVEPKEVGNVWCNVYQTYRVYVMAEDAEHARKVAADLFRERLAVHGHAVGYVSP